MQDVHGEQLSKEKLREEMQSTKRVDNIQPNLELNSELVRRYHKVRILFDSMNHEY